MARGQCVSKATLHPLTHRKFDSTKGHPGEGPGHCYPPAGAAVEIILSVHLRSLTAGGRSERVSFSSPFTVLLARLICYSR
jgi:hypothetical protein